MRLFTPIKHVFLTIRGERVGGVRRSPVRLEDHILEVRRIINTTNSIESLNYQLSKIIKNRGHFPNDYVVVKLSCRVKEGDMGAAWVNERTSARVFALAGNRIGVIGNDNVAYVKQGDLSAPWTTEYLPASGLAMSGTAD